MFIKKRLSNRYLRLLKENQSYSLGDDYCSKFGKSNQINKALYDLI